MARLFLQRFGADCGYKIPALGKRSRVAMADLNHGQGARLPGQAAELRPDQKISGEIPHPWRAAGSVGRRLELSLESRIVRGEWLRGRHDQLPRLDRLWPEVH